MAAPVLQAQGAIAAVTTGNLTVTLAAHQADDILVVALAAWVPNTPAGIADITAPSGWAQIAQLDTNDDGRIAWFWKRAASGAESNPVFTRPAGWDTGTDTCWVGRAYTVRGCITAGDPWDEADPTVIYNTASQAFDAVTVSGSERTVIQFFNSQDNQSAGAAPSGWTAGTAVTTATGTDAGFQTFRKDNVNVSTSADASNASAPGQGRYAFLGVSFKPPISGVVGDLSQTLGALTSGADGDVSVAGALTRTLAAATLVGDADVLIAGDLSRTLAASTLTADGTVGGSTPVSGDLDVTLAALALTAEGEVAVTGALSRTLTAATLSAAGAVGDSGSTTSLMRRSSGGFYAVLRRRK